MSLSIKSNIEEKRLSDAEWRTWGPYLSDRQWGTVREDYSADGAAWEYLSHDMARSRAYRWGEDGIAGISDIDQQLCFSVAMWNGSDPIIKERYFGLSGNEGNHGEDVKELYYYLDSTPSHSYMKMLYKYPQGKFPYSELIETNRCRTKNDPEFEIIDSGIFDNERYFDVFVEYAKVSPTDIQIRITAHNRGDKTAKLQLLPQLWFRNTWAWDSKINKPQLSAEKNRISVSHNKLDNYYLHFEDGAQALFCDNETNVARCFGVSEQSGFAKDGINDYIITGDKCRINAKQLGTKCALQYCLELAPKESSVIKLRLANQILAQPFVLFDKVFEERISEADSFYSAIQSSITCADARNVQRQAFAGMLWSKQFYYYEVSKWLSGDEKQPTPPNERREGRNSAWQHLRNAHVISMPDKWEYPWYAAWDLAFHCIPLAMIDPGFAKDQLQLLTHEWYLHPNGQIPAYEWSFSDVNPPVHAWATWRVYKIDKKANSGKGDRDFLERVFQKLLINFTWWINRKDEHGHNIFQGGFLGLDNIGVFDRSARLPTGGHLEQADATAWVAMYALNMMRIALELAIDNPIYQDMATKFFEHFLLIAKAMVNMGEHGTQLWDEQDEFYYDSLHTGEGRSVPLRVRSMVGIIPLFAVETLEPELLAKVPEFARRLEWTLQNRPDLAELVSRWQVAGQGERRLLSLVRGHRMKCILRRVLDQNEFLSPYGVRALSKYHLDNPYVFNVQGQDFSVRYQAGESDSGLFGGNSNWRGPVWMPVNYLLIESLQKFHHYYGDDFKVECPSGTQNFVTIAEVAAELSKRLTAIFLQDKDGRRAVFSDQPTFQNDPNFRDYLFFYEYFHGDSGRGVGASHQTGWTGLIAKLLATSTDHRSTSKQEQQ